MYSEVHFRYAKFCYFSCIEYEDKYLVLMSPLSVNVQENLFSPTLNDSICSSLKSDVSIFGTLNLGAATTIINLLASN